MPQIAITLSKKSNRIVELYMAEHDISSKSKAINTILENLIVEL